ncbi:hypothetical protein VTK26DRAFT_2524 [Humicola hyalothermophila]
MITSSGRQNGDGKDPVRSRVGEREKKIQSKSLTIVQQDVISGVRPGARSQCDAVAILNRGQGPVCLAGRCCGSSSCWAWICIPPRLTLAIPDPPPAPLTLLSKTLAASSCHLGEKSLPCPLQIHISGPTAGRIGPVETIGLVSTKVWHAIMKLG